MKTEDLNEYVFTSLVIDIAQIFRRDRVEAMYALANSDEEKKEAGKSPLTDEDMRKAFVRLNERRQTVSALIKELRPDLLAYP